MEHGTAMNILWRIALVFVLCCGVAHAGDRDLVIVASAKSTLPRFTPTEVRRMYLGIPMVHDGRQVYPLHNVSDKEGDEVFMQKVLFMSSSAYEKRIVSLTFRNGVSQIVNYKTLDSLVKALNDDVFCLTVMTQEAVASVPGVKVLGALWQE
jgi:hypothetical protein